LHDSITPWCAASEHALVSDWKNARCRNRRRQLGDEFERLDNDARRTIATTLLELIQVPFRLSCGLIVCAERHLQRLFTSFAAYYHEDRTHLGLAQQAPVVRAVKAQPNSSAYVLVQPSLGGLQHRCEWRRAA
jgi:hypothetical protein